MEGKGANAGKAPFGAGIFVDLPLLEDARTGKCGKLLLIVNSQQCKEAPYALREIDTIMGPDSIDVIPCVFELVRDVHLKILFMPSIGTKRLSSAYQAVVASVISRYLCSMLECRRPYSLVFSPIR